ncbi:MAG TPA: hypothetical protein ENJ82_09990 [Bacteroidetes bacterium]|nr:hypothetical protein [Bacteroidota bacterium]
MAVYNGANLNIYHKNYGKSDELMSLIDKISDTKVREPALFYETRILHELWIGIATSDITRSENAIMELQLLPPETVERIDPVKKIEIFHSSSIASIIAGKPADALRSINLLRTSKPLYMRKDLRQYARILFLVVHYDLGNVDIVETGVKAARISFTRSKVESLYYKSILKMFSRLARSKSPEKTNAAMLDFLKGFSGKTADTWNKMNLYFNIRVWLISKLEKVTFTSALKNKEFSKTIGNDDNATSSHHNAE